MQIKIALSFLLISMLNLHAQGQECSIDISLMGIKQSQGNLMIAVFDKAEYFLTDSAIQTAIVPVAQSGTMQITLTGFIPGEYALSVFQDLNSNGELDKNFMGIPSEPYGFSNNARGSFGPPKFNDAKFSLTLQHQTFEITLY